MSKGEDHDCFAICPYFDSRSPGAIYCEGIEQGSRLRLTFPDKSKIRTYSNEHCNSNDWKKCRIARMLEKKWEDFFNDKTTL